LQSEATRGPPLMPKPVSPEFIANLGRSIEEGVALHRAGRLNEAEKVYARILKSIPDQYETLQLMAELQVARGKLAEAHRLASTAVAVRPRAADPLVQLGYILRALRRDDEALASFERALALEPNHIDALGLRGDALLGRGRAAEALACFDRILAIAPRHAGARGNRAAALAALGHFEDALSECEMALSIAPSDGLALYNRANALANLGRPEEALAAYDRLLAVAPQHAAAWNNRGNTLSALRRQAEAVDSFAKAIVLRPDYADAHFNQALAHLALGDYARGFAAYEWRWKRSGMPAPRNYGRPLWLGEFPLARKTILLSAEQGLGDSIQFARYVPVLANAGASVMMEVQAELKTLFSRLAGAAQVVARGETLPPFDVHCPLGSLPLAMKTIFDNVPAHIPYLAADESRVAKWRPRLETLKRPRVALVWAGNANHPNDRNRSIAFARLGPLLNDGVGSLISLQREPRAADAEALKAARDILHLGDELADLDDTAAIMTLCDLVISVDTSVVHLAAAMGRPTWVLLPFAPDWRWTLAGEHSPWYPGARLFRQAQAGDWASVIERVRMELASFGKSA
jgi:tetratricopeptide (TPR) repeat protein